MDLVPNDELWITAACDVEDPDATRASMASLSMVARSEHDSQTSVTGAEPEFLPRSSFESNRAGSALGSPTFARAFQGSTN